MQLNKMNRHVDEPRTQKVIDGILRSKLAKLIAAGFLTSGVGRQGTQITDSGELFRAKVTQI